MAAVPQTQLLSSTLMVCHQGLSKNQAKHLCVWERATKKRKSYFSHHVRKAEPVIISRQIWDMLRIFGAITGSPNTRVDLRSWCWSIVHNIYMNPLGVLKSCILSLSQGSQILKHKAPYLNFQPRIYCRWRDKPIMHQTLGKCLGFFSSSCIALHLKSKGLISLLLLLKTYAFGESAGWVWVCPSSISIIHHLFLLLCLDYLLLCDPIRYNNKRQRFMVKPWSVWTWLCMIIQNDWTDSSWLVLGAEMIHVQTYFWNGRKAACQFLVHT